jgi:hypothetical protein
MKTDVVPSKPQAITRLPQKPAGPVAKTRSLTVAFANEDSSHLVIQGQPQEYFLPSPGPLWVNPLNDF